MSNSKTNSKVLLITGAGKRVGACLARHCHQQGMRIAIHYRNSDIAAQEIAKELNQKQKDSVITLPADLKNIETHATLVGKVIEKWGRLDVLVNNASSFYPTPLGKITEASWEDLLGSNLKAPLFLSQTAAPYLEKETGCIINMVDIQAQRPMKQYSLYCVAKAGLVMLTKSLAKELGPSVRVNAIAPGIALWPDDEREVDPGLRERIIKRTALKRPGTPQDLAETVSFLVNHAPYITGQIIAVDGGLSLDY